MLKNIETFLEEKEMQEELRNGLAFVCQGGSHISGTNDHTSDLDYRGIVIPPDDYLLGLKKFEHTKLLSGENKMNGKDDLDIELFSFDRFINEAYHGEIVTAEMLYVDDAFVLKKNELLHPLFENRELFLSKGIARRYSHLIKGYKKRMTLPSSNFRRPDNIERVNTYGFETKCAMKAVQLLRLTVEFLQTGNLHLYRKDREALLAIKNGKTPFNLIKQEVDERERELESLLKTSPLPERANFKNVNQFKKDYTLFLFKTLGTINSK